MGNAEYMGLTHDYDHSVVISYVSIIPYLQLLYRFINSSFRFNTVKKRK